MSLVYIVAAAPWGPVRIETAASSADMLRQITAQPAHVEDVGSLDADKIAEAARRMLGGANAAGWNKAKVDASR